MAEISDWLRDTINLKGGRSRLGNLPRLSASLKETTKNGLADSYADQTILRERVRNLLQHQLDVGILQPRTLDFSQGLVHSVLLVDGVNEFGLIVLLSHTPEISN